MSKKIKTLIAPIMMFLGSLTHAATVQGCDKDGLACKASAFDFALTAVYFKAYSDFFPRNSVGNSTSTDVSGSGGDSSSRNGPWDWGGIIDGRYHFLDRADINFNWMYYSVDYHGAGISQDSFTSGSVTTNNNSISQVSGNIKLNSVNGEYAHSFDLSPRSVIRLFAGAQYLNIKNKSNNVSQSRSISGRDVSSTRAVGVSNNKYEGIGPRLGFDTHYKLKGNLSLLANGAASLLLAKRTGSGSSTSFSRSSTSSDSSTDLSTLSSNRGIPELEAKLGLTYEQLMAQGVASVSAGWSVINYFSLLGGNRNDLTLSGPFLQGKWLG